MNLRARTFVAVALCLALLAAAPPLQRLDSQIVLQRYAMALDAVKVPKAVILSYAISQAGPTQIDQRHRLYRSGDQVRDETLVVNGSALREKLVTIGRREDRYAVARVAPRTDAYQIIFLRALLDGNHLDYEYETTPLAASEVGFAVHDLVIDGQTYLPRRIAFRTSNGDARGDGSLTFAKTGPFWMIQTASVDATVGGKSAREHVAFGDYEFPSSLPAATFVAPKPIPHATLPPI